MQANAGPQRPTKTHKDPTQANKGQQGPTQAYKGMEGCIGLKMQGRYVFSFFFFFYILTSYERPCRPMQAHKDPWRPTKANTGQKKIRNACTIACTRISYVSSFFSLLFYFIWDMCTRICTCISYGLIFLSIWNVCISNHICNLYVLRYRICIKYMYLNNSFWLEQHQTTSESMPL